MLCTLQNFSDASVNCSGRDQPLTTWAWVRGRDGALTERPQRWHFAGFREKKVHEGNLGYPGYRARCKRGREERPATRESEVQDE